MKPDESQVIQRGSDADALLQHPLIREALDHYEQELTTAWKNSKAKDAHGREELHRRLHAAAHFRTYLLATANDGRVTRDRVERLSAWDQIKDRVRSFRMVRK